MKMEWIARILFATTVVSIFSYLLIFYSVGLAGNGGEYWNLDPDEDPRRAARTSFENGDRRLLKINIESELGHRVTSVPIRAYCDERPLGGDMAHRVSSSEPIHGADSTRLATEYAHAYNNMMAKLNAEALKLPCKVTWGSYRSPWHFIKTSNLVIYFIGIVTVLYFLTLIAQPSEKKLFRRRLLLVQERIRKKEDERAEKDRVRENIERERRSRRIIRKFRRFVHRRK